MAHINVKLSGLTGYKLSVQLKKHQGVHPVMAFLTSIPVLFCARTISIVADVRQFVGKEKLYDALVEQKIKITDRKPSISSHNDGSGNPNNPADRIENLSDWFDFEKHSTEPKMEKASGSKMEKASGSGLQFIPEPVYVLKDRCLKYSSALVKEEKEADEKYERLVKLRKAEREANAEDLAVTFCGTQTMGKGARAYGGCDINALNKENASAIIHTQSKYALVKLYYKKIDEEKEPAIDITADIVLKKVRDVIESKIYDPDNMDKMYVDYVEQDELMNLITPTPEGKGSKGKWIVKFKEGSGVNNNEEGSGVNNNEQEKRLQRERELLRRENVIVEQRECFENKVFSHTALNHDGTINMKKSVSFLMGLIKNNHRNWMRIQEEKGNNDTKLPTDENLEKLPTDENLEQMLEHLIYSCYQKKTNPYGFKFMCLKRAFMISIGIHNPNKFFSRMTRENFIAFHKKYKEEIISRVLKQIPLSGLINEVVSEVMGSDLLPKISTKPLTKPLKEGQNNSKENVLKEAEKIVRNYSKALANKAIESVGLYRPISDDIVKDTLQKYELVHLHERDETNFLLRVRGSGHDERSNIWVEYNKESNTFVEGCDLEEAKCSYAQHKEALCCFDDIAFSTISRVKYKRKADELVNNDANENSNKKKKQLKALVKLDQKKIYEDITDESGKTTQQRKETLKRVSEMLAKQREEVRQYSKEVLNEISAVMGRRFREDNAAVADLNDPNRPIKLTEKISSFYTDIQTDAITALEDLGGIKQSERVLCTIFRSCYELTVKNFEKEQRRMDAALNNVGRPKMRSSDNTELREKINNIHHCDCEQKVNIYSREIANTIYNQMGDVPYNPKYIEDFTQDELTDTCTFLWFESEKGQSWLAGHSESDQKKCVAQVNMMAFIKTASELSYKMCASNPPVILKWVEGDDEFEGKAYTKKMEADIWRLYVRGTVGDIIDYTVWPTVWLTKGEKGDILMAKGVVEIISQDK